MIKSFRGQLADGDVTTIRLSTNNGLTGYRIVKFELFPQKPGTISQESVMVISKTEETEPYTLTTVDFNDPNLLGVGYLLNHATATDNPAYMSSVFDNMKFNQDIFIAHVDVKNSEICNYYLELEQMRLRTDEAAVATLKDMRGRE
jgi:hypothetical protein